MSKIYLAEHCYCIYESGFFALSAHKTIRGAREAMRNSIKREWTRNGNKEQPFHNAKKEDMWFDDHAFQHQRWRVRGVILKD